MENLDDELREISPLLRDLKNQGDGFRTPEGYFDDLADQVIGRLDTMGARRSAPGLQATPGGQWFRRLLQPRMLTAIAAGLALAAAAFWFFKSPSVAEQPPAPVPMAGGSGYRDATSLLLNRVDWHLSQMRFHSSKTSQGLPNPRGEVPHRLQTHLAHCWLPAYRSEEFRPRW